MRQTLLSIALGLLLMLPASAQIAGMISGVVTDQTGASIPGAKVTVTSEETGAKRVDTTGNDGTYRITALPVGRYRIDVEAQGFLKSTVPLANLAVGQDFVFNTTLLVADTDTVKVEVLAEGPVVNTTTSSVSGLVGEREVKELPLNGRSFDNLIALNPGAVNYTLKSPNTSTSNGNTFSVAGRRPLDNLVLLNGVEYGGSSQLAVTPGGVSGYLLGIDAVREFNVLTETYSAEYGKRAGGQVTVVTQSGTNQMHGSMFEFLRNNVLDARSFLDLGYVPPFRRNQFGGSLGGPLKKDGLFIFGNYEAFRESLAVSSLSIVPDANTRLGKLPDGTSVANVNAGMLAYMAMWPVANGPALPPPAGQPGSAQAYYNPKQSKHESFGTARSDYNVRDRDALAFSYTIDDGNSVVPQGDPLFASALALRSHVASIQETHIFSPRALNTLNLGFSRAGFNLDSVPPTAFPAGLSFVTGGGPGGIVIGGGVTTTGAGTITSAGPINSGVSNRRNLFTYSDSVQMSRGIHQLSMGVWFQRLRDNENIAGRRLGQATFASLTTFLQGTVQTFQVVPNANELGWRSWFGAWFVEDSIKLRRNLTVRLGLRHEFTNGWNEESGRAANYITDSSNVLITNPRVADGVFTQNNAKKMFSPRVAIAWDPFGNGKTSLRAGFGTYYSIIDNLAFLMNSLPPYNGSVSCANRSLFAVVPIPAGFTPACPFAPQGIQADAKTPTVQEWNFTIEQQLTSNTGLRVAYVGSRGYHGLLSLDPNTIPAQICANASGCLAGGTATAAASQSNVAQGVQYIPVGTRPNPNVGAGFFWYTEGNSSYNGLQVDVNRRLTQGLQFRANYTWSKNLDMNSGLTGAQSNNQAQMILDRNNTRRDWGPSALNVTHQASISARYELPFGRGKALLGNATGLANKLASGWQVSGIATMLSGFPFTPQVGSNRSGDGDTRNPDRPHLNPAFSGSVVTGNPGQWFNPAAFSPPAFGTYGSLGRGVYSGPGLANLDLSLMKNTAITERIGLQFRAEAFNLLNHTNYGTPNALVFSGASISASAGFITTAATYPRQIQFGLKLTF